LFKQFRDIVVVAAVYPCDDRTGDVGIGGLVVDVNPRPPRMGTLPSANIFLKVGTIFAIFYQFKNSRTRKVPPPEVIPFKYALAS
jgi:hypothetical protein